MNRPHYDVAVWQTHETEDDCELIIRTSNGRAFYCTIIPSEFHRSPQVTEQYFKCLNLLRSGDEEIDDFYMEDACDWLSKAFEPVIAQLAPATLTLPLSSSGRPTLSHYLFPTSYVCSLAATDEKLQPYTLSGKEHGWGNPLTLLDGAFCEDFESWTRSYHTSDVEICYDRPQDILIKPPTRVVVRNKEDQPTLFFKRLNTSFGNNHAKAELEVLKRIAMADIPSDALVCRLHGVVRNKNGVAGMLFPWIDKKSVLSRARAEQASASLRRRWADQIRRSLEALHERGIIWGDAKAENILVDENDDAWIIDFGGSYTVGWVDKEKAGTLDGDMQVLFRDEYHAALYEWVNTPGNATIQTTSGAIYFDQAHVLNGLHPTTSQFDTNPDPHVTIRFSNAALRGQRSWYILHWRPGGGSVTLPNPDNEADNDRRRQKRKEKKKRQQERKKEDKGKKDSDRNDRGGKGGSASVGQGDGRKAGKQGRT